MTTTTTTPMIVPIGMFTSPPIVSSATTTTSTGLSYSRESVPEYVRLAASGQLQFQQRAQHLQSLQTIAAQNLDAGLMFKPRAPQRRAQQQQAVMNALPEPQWHDVIPTHDTITNTTPLEKLHRQPSPTQQQQTAVPVRKRRVAAPTVRRPRRRVTTDASVQTVTSPPTKQTKKSTSTAATASGRRRRILPTTNSGTGHNNRSSNSSGNLEDTMKQFMSLLMERELSQQQSSQVQTILQEKFEAERRCQELERSMHQLQGTRGTSAGLYMHHHHHQQQQQLHQSSSSSEHKLNNNSSGLRVQNPALLSHVASYAGQFIAENVNELEEMLLDDLLADTVHTMDDIYNATQAQHVQESRQQVLEYAATVLNDVMGNIADARAKYQLPSSSNEPPSSLSSRVAANPLEQLHADLEALSRIKFDAQSAFVPSSPIRRVSPPPSPRSSSSSSSSSSSVPAAGDEDEKQQNQPATATTTTTTTATATTTAEQENTRIVREVVTDAFVAEVKKHRDGYERHVSALDWSFRDDLGLSMAELQDALTNEVLRDTLADCVYEFTALSDAYTTHVYNQEFGIN